MGLNACEPMKMLLLDIGGTTTDIFFWWTGSHYSNPGYRYSFYKADQAFTVIYGLGDNVRLENRRMMCPRRDVPLRLRRSMPTPPCHEALVW